MKATTVSCYCFSPSHSRIQEADLCCQLRRGNHLICHLTKLCVKLPFLKQFGRKCLSSPSFSADSPSFSSPKNSADHKSDVITNNSQPRPSLSLKHRNCNPFAMDMLKLFILFICCCYPTLAWERSKNPIQFTSTFPKEVQVLLHQDITVTCPKLKGGTKDMKLIFFYRFQSNGPEQKEVFINQSTGQYVIDTKNGVLTIKRFDKQNEGKYSCAALVLLGNEERVAVSSSFKMYIDYFEMESDAEKRGDEEAMITVDDSLIKMHPHDDVILLPISRPKVSFDERHKPPLLKVSWTVPDEMAADDSPDAVDDVIPSPIIEPYSEFVIQMKHYTSFVEDWHNLSRIDIDTPQEGPQTHNMALSEFETGYGEYRILGMSKSGRSRFSELSEGLRIDLKTNEDHSSDHGHDAPGDSNVVRREDIPPVITRATALSDHSILLEWTFDDYYMGGDIHVSGFVVQYSPVHGHPSSGGGGSSSGQHGSGVDGWDKLPQEVPELFLETPNLRMHVIQNLVPNTQYQFRIKAVGTSQWATIYSQPKFAITSKDSWAISGQGTSTNPENDVDRKLEDYLVKHGEKDNHLVLMLVVGGCVSLILIAIIVSVSILAIYRQRLNNSITNKIIMREMEEEMKRRESTLRKSANMEQSSVLGSGCSEHSVNSSPIGCDDSNSSNQCGTSMMNRHSLTPPMISPGSVSIAGPTALYSQTRIPNLISLPSSGAVTGYPVLPLIPSSLVATTIGPTIHEAGGPGEIIAPIPQSRYDSSLVFNTVNELREYMPNSNLPSPTVSNITLPQPLKTLHSPALFSKYSSPQQNYLGNTEFTSFKALRDLTTNAGSTNNPGNLLRGISPKSSLLPRPSAQNYTIDEDDQTMSNYQGLPLNLTINPGM